VVHYCSSVAPSNNRQIAAQSLTDTVQELLASFMDDVRARLEEEVHNMFVITVKSGVKPVNMTLLL